MLTQTSENIGAINVGGKPYWAQRIRTGSVCLVYVFRTDNLALRGVVFPTFEAFKAWDTASHQLVLF